MLKVKCGTTLVKNTYTIIGNTIIAQDGTQTTMPAAVTLRNVLDAAGVNYAKGMTNLDGETVNAASLDKSFVELGLTDGLHHLTNVAKADNA